MRQILDFTIEDDKDIIPRLFEVTQVEPNELVETAADAIAIDSGF